MSLSRTQWWARQHRSQAESTAVALVALAVALVLGVAARGRMASVRSELARLKAADAEVATFRALFRSADPTKPDSFEDWQQLPDSLAIVVPRDLRVSLAEEIVGRAERLGLTGVRVRFSTGDTAAAPKPPELAGGTVRVADYTVSVDCVGGFAAVLSLVRGLPPSVALERLTATRAAGGGQYHLSLAVFETASSGSAAGAVAARRSGEHG